MAQTRKPTPTNRAAKPAAKPATPSAKLTTLRKLSKTAALAKNSAEKAKRSRCEELLALIARRKVEIVEAFYDLGEALREIERKELYRALNERSFEALLKKHKVMGLTQAYKLIKIVENVPRDVALGMGQEKAFALVSYTEATQAKDSVAGLVKSNAKIAGVSASKISARAVREASKAERDKRPKSSEQKAKEKEHKALAQRLVAAMARLGVKQLKLERKSDRVLLTLSYEQLAKLADK